MAHQVRNLKKQGSADHSDDVFNSSNLNEYVESRSDLEETKKNIYYEISKTLYSNPEYLCTNGNGISALSEQLASCYDKQSGKRKQINDMNENNKTNKNLKNNYFSVIINQVHPNSLPVEKVDTSKIDSIGQSMNNGNHNIDQIKKEQIKQEFNESSYIDKNIWENYKLLSEKIDIERMHRRINSGIDMNFHSNNLKQEGFYNKPQSRPMRESSSSNDSDLKKTPLYNNGNYKQRMDGMHNNMIDFEMNYSNGWNKNKNFQSPPINNRFLQDFKNFPNSNNYMNNYTNYNNAKWNELRRNQTLGSHEAPIHMESHKGNKNSGNFASNLPVMNSYNWMSDIRSHPIMNRGYMNNNTMNHDNRCEEFRKCASLGKSKANYELKDYKPVDKNTNEDDPNIIKLFFGNLAPITTEKDMYDLLSPFGRCSSLIILKDRRGKSRGSGFVTFYNKDEAINVIKSLNNKITLNGAHKAMEIRFPEDKTEKQLRIQVLTEARIQGEKIAPSGCLPIKTEDVLTKKIKPNYIPQMWRNMNDMEFMNLGASNNTDYSIINSQPVKKPIFEQYKASSNTSTDTPNNNFYNRMDENETAIKFLDSSMKCIQNSYMDHENKEFPEILENNILLPKFLIDDTLDNKNILSETINSFKGKNNYTDNSTTPPLYNNSTDEKIIQTKVDASEFKSTMLNDNTNNKFIQKTPERRVSYSNIENYLLSPIFSSDQTDFVNNNNNDDICNGYLKLSKIKDSEENLFDYLNNNFYDLNDKDDTLQNELKIEKNENSLKNNYDNSNIKYDNQNVYEMGFDLSHLFINNQEPLVNEEKKNKLNKCKLIENNDSCNKMKIQKSVENIEEEGSGSSIKISNSKEDIKYENVKTESNNINDTSLENDKDLKCEMLQNIMKLYTKNKGLINSSQMHNYLWNALSEIYYSLQLVDVYNVKNSLDKKNIKEEI